MLGIAVLPWAKSAGDKNTWTYFYHTSFYLSSGGSRRSAKLSVGRAFRHSGTVLRTTFSRFLRQFVAQTSSVQWPPDGVAPIANRCRLFFCYYTIDFA